MLFEFQLNEMHGSIKMGQKRCKKLSSEPVCLPTKQAVGVRRGRCPNALTPCLTVINLTFICLINYMLFDCNKVGRKLRWSLKEFDLT